MKPILYESNETAFADLGIGVLADALSVYVEEERNGEYELTAVFPVDGQFVDELQPRRLILAKPNYTDPPQPFRIYKIQKSLSGATVTVRAQHLSYDLIGYTATPFVAGDITAALAGLTSHCITNDCPFTLTTTRTTVASFTADVPASIRSWLGGKEGSLLDIYGGEWHYNGYVADLEVNRGANRGARIMYGKNLLTLEQEQECSNLYSAVYPYWKGQDDTVVTGNLTPVAPVNYTRVLVLDFSDKFDDGEVPTSQQLTIMAAQYVAANNLSTPKVNLKLDFAQLQDIPERIDLCDIVTVYFEKFGISAQAECIRTRWDVLRDRYESIELGDAKQTLADTIVGQAESITMLGQAAQKDYGDLMSTITTVEQTLRTSIDANDEAITTIATRTTSIEDNMVTADGVETLLATKDYVTTSTLTQTADDITAEITSLQSTVDNQGADLSELTTAITIDAAGVTVAKSNSNIKGVFGNSSLDFVNASNVRQAWISADEDGLGASQLSLGDPSLASNRWRIYTSADANHLRFTRHI